MGIIASRGPPTTARARRNSSFHAQVYLPGKAVILLSCVPSSVGAALRSNRGLMGVVVAPRGGVPDRSVAERGNPAPSQRRHRDSRRPLCSIHYVLAATV